MTSFFFFYQIRHPGDLWNEDSGNESHGGEKTTSILFHLLQLQEEGGREERKEEGMAGGGEREGRKGE